MIDGLYYMYITLWILYGYMYIKDCLNIYIYSCLGGGGRLGSLLLRIEPRGLYPWDIFFCPLGVSIIDIKICTFSIGVNSFIFLLLISWLFFVLGHIFFFYPDFIYWDWVEFSFDTEDYGHCVGWAAVPVLNISFMIYWDVVSCGFNPFLLSVRY